MDKTDAEQQTIAMFIEKLPNHADTAKNEYREMISGLKAAWSLVGHKLKNHRKLVLFSPYAMINLDSSSQVDSPSTRNTTSLQLMMRLLKWSTLSPPHLRLVCVPQPWWTFSLSLTTTLSRSAGSL
ncbi:MAG: hypothetical protein MJE68_10020 [Proteobacteria bacterium]|nr:hypothetical protein [Pseudomonadota bacterium]